MAANVDIVINAQDNASSVFGGLTVTLGDVLNIAGKVAGGVVDMFKSVIDESASAQEGQAQLASVLESTGGKAGVTADQANQLASALQLTTKFTDDQVLSTENMLLTFTNISKDVFPDVTKTALNMSQALGQDTKASAVQLGKALNDPIKGISALSKVGVAFTQEQKDQIKVLVEAGDTMGAQKIILSELNTEFGGAAEAAGKTFGGQMAILSHQFDDVKQQIGDALLPVLSQFMGFVGTNLMPILQMFGAWLGERLPVAVAFLTTALAPLGTIITDVADAFGDGGLGAAINVVLNEVFGLNTKIGFLIEDGLGRIIDIIGQVVTSFQAGGDGANALGATVQTLGQYWADLQPTITNVVNAVQDVVLAVFGVIQEFIQEHGADISATMKDAWTKIQEIVKLGIELYNAIVPPVLRAIAGFLKSHGAEIQAILSAVWSSVKAIIDAALTLIKGVISVALDLIHGNWQQAWEDIKSMSARIVEDIIAVLKADLDILKTVFGGAIKWIQDAWAALPNQLSNVGGAIVAAIKQGIENAWGELVDWFNSKLQELKDKLPFSEPKDSSSPLYGLSKSGKSIVRNLQDGIASAPQLQIGGPVIGGVRTNAGGNGSITGATRAATSARQSDDQQPVVVHIQFADGMGWLKDFVTTTVNGAAYKGNFRVRTGG